METRSGELSDELASVLAQLRPDVVVMARVDAMTRSVLGLLHGAEAAPSMVLLV